MVEAPSLARRAATLLGNLFVHPMAQLSSRDEKLWLFGAPSGRFEGNSKYLFLWLALNGLGSRSAWITPNKELAAQLRRRNLRAYAQWSPQGLAAALRAGVYFVNDNASDVHFSLSNGATIFNLWHGVGLKNVLFGATVGTSAKLHGSKAGPWSRLRAMRRLQRPDYVLSTSPQMSALFFAPCFAVPVERAPALGYPRLDPHVDDRLKQHALTFEDYSPLDVAGDKRAILYAPTLREYGETFLAKALPDLQRLSASLAMQNALLFLKLHPKMTDEAEAFTDLPANIIMLPEQMDLYPVLDRFAALVTDYSSLFFDYIAFRSEGVALYAFDLEEYTRVERDLAWNYDDATLGIRANSFEQLCSIIGDGRIFAPLEAGKLQQLRKRFWGGVLGEPTASRRIYDFLRQEGAA